MSGYYQILMDKADKKKNSFIIKDGTNYYKVMPFGLKKYWGHISKINEYYLQRPDRQEHNSIRTQHDSKEYVL